MVHRYVHPYCLAPCTDGSRILTPYFAFKQHMHYPKVNYQKFNLRDEVEVDGLFMKNEHRNVKGNNYLLARKVAAESTVYVARRRLLM
jgi:beta-glucosidase